MDNEQIIIDFGIPDNFDGIIKPESLNKPLPLGKKYPEKYTIDEVLYYLELHLRTRNMQLQKYRTPVKIKGGFGQEFSQIGSVPKFIEIDINVSLDIKEYLIELKELKGVL